MEVHYLEWSDLFGQQSTQYSKRPKETSTVSVIDDQSSYVAKDYAPFTQTLKTSAGATITREIPGRSLRGLIEYF